MRSHVEYVGENPNNFRESGMTQDSKVIAAVDVGTTKVCTIVARQEGTRQFSVISYSVVPSRGMDKGTVTDISEAEESIRSSISEATGKVDETVTSAYVGITGSHVSFENRSDRIDWAATKGVITRSDLEKIPQTVAEASRQPGRQVIHALPSNYVLDGQSGIVDPLGMHTRRMEVDSHVVSAEVSLVRRLTQAVEKAGVAVQALVLEPLASAESVLSEVEKYEGSVLVDMGGGTSDIIMFDRGIVEYTSVLPIGGFQFTNDMCVAFNTTYDAAEMVKLEYGNTDPATFGALDDVGIPVRGRHVDTRVGLRDISQLLRERARELLRLIRIKMAEAGIDDTTKSTLVLTGGSSRLPGLDTLVKRHLTPNVRIGGANPISGLPEILRGPEFATSVGLLMWALKHPSPPPDSPTQQSSPSSDNSHRARRSRLLRWMFPE
jgi:cell division protein FtsA